MIKGDFLHILTLYLIFATYCLCLFIHKPLSSISNNLFLIQNKIGQKSSKMNTKFTTSFINFALTPIKFDKKTNLIHEDHNTSYVEPIKEISDQLPHDSISIYSENPKTNLVMIVSYDGTNYHGVTGPMMFLTNYGLPTKSQNHDINSISNELLRSITMIHGYFGKKKRIKLRKSSDFSKMECSDDSCTSTQNGDLEDDNLTNEINKEFERRFTLITSSRTDTGVHSMGTAFQYLSFDKNLNFENLEDFQDTLNRFLPSDIRVTSLIHSPKDEFNVRFNNIGKSYLYKIDLSPTPSIFERNYWWQLMSDKHFCNTLNRKYKDMKSHFSIERVMEAGKEFHGTHNFEAFRKMSKGSERDQVVDPICTIKSIDIYEKSDNKIEIVVNGDRFLYKMVRCIVGHLVLAGFKIITPEQIKNALDTATEIPNIPYAPAHGLYLKKVYFEKDVQDKLDESNSKYYERLKKILN